MYYSLDRNSSEKNKFETNLNKMKKMMKKHVGTEYTFDGDYEKYFNLYYKEEKEKIKIKNEDGTEEEKEISKQVFVTWTEKTDVIENEIKYFGFFAIVTSDEMSAREAISFYKGRDVSEKLFISDKTFLGNESYRVYSQESTDAKIFVEFIGLIVRNRIYNALRKEMKNLDSKHNYMTVPAALKELEKIEMVKQTDNLYRLSHAVTKTQKTILKAFNMTESTIRNEANLIQKELIRIAELSE